MKIKIESNPSKSKVDLTAVGIYLDEPLTKVLKDIFGSGAAQDELTSRAVAVAREEGFKGKLGQVLSLPTYGLVTFRRLFLFGLGSIEDASKLDYSGYRKLGVNVSKRLMVSLRTHADDSHAAQNNKDATKSESSNLSSRTAKLKTKGKNQDKAQGANLVAKKEVSACFCLRSYKGSASRSVSPTFVLESIIEAFILSSFSYDKYKMMKEAGKQAKLEAAASLLPVTLFFAGVEKGSFDRAVQKAWAIGQAVNMARGLIAEPPAYMTPTRLSIEARRIAADHGLSVNIFDQLQIEKMAMGSFLGVARGAKEPPRFIVLKYTAPRAKKTVALVGKGVTFDSGGLSLKTAVGMEHMKYDMAGAASVLAAMQVIGELKPKVSVIAVVPATENMPGSNALHPGDVLIAMNGKTIEVNNTDAEGRLILADALTYAIKEGADELIDIATLTGAVVSALGRVAAGIMGSNQRLVDDLIAAGVPSGEKYWQLPLFEEYKDALKSDIADLKNAGSRGEAGSSCAAMFLREFTADKPWAHLDIAGVAWRESEREEMTKGGTGFGIRTLCNYVLAQ